MIYEHATPQFNVEKLPSGQPSLSMTYEPSLRYKIFNGLNSFTFRLRPDTPFVEVYALEDMLSKYVEEVSVQGD